MIQPRDYQQLAYEAGIQHARATDEPCILELGTAAGKSIIVAMLAQTVQRAKKRVLVLMPNGDLCVQNSQKYKDIGEKCSIYSAKLGKKHTGHPVVFATPISVANNLDDFGDEYALVIVDECHTVSEEEDSSYQKILAHLKSKNKRLRLIGLTATPVRFKTKLVNKNTTFKHTAYRMQSHQLATAGWTVPYVLGATTEGYHLADVKVQSNGKFKASDIDALTLDKERLTRAIVDDVVRIMDEQGRKCGMFFAASLKHAAEVMSYLPAGESAIIDGKTAGGERSRILEETRDGKWRYLVNVGTLTTGTDLPIVDTIALLRATEAIGLLIQILGRGCRLYDPLWQYGQMNRLDPNYQGKMDCLVLDYGSNLERFALDDDMTITGLIAAKNAQDADDDYLIVDCPECGHGNRHTAQRCVGVTALDTRCEYRFVFKTCEACDTKNSPSARYCRHCEAELINPEDKLTRKAAIGPGVPFFVDVHEMELRPHYKNGSESLRVDYTVDDGERRFVVSEFLKPEAEYWGTKKKFHDFAQQVGAIGNNVANVVAEAALLTKPDRILIKKQKGTKFYEIVSRAMPSSNGDRKNQLDQIAA